MKSLLYIILFLSAGASLKAVASHDTDKGQTSLRAGSRRTQDDCDSVLDIICKLQNTRTFCAMVRTAITDDPALFEGISGGSPYTVFAPTDTAFEQTPQLEELSPEEKHRTLMFHFYQNVIMTNDDLDCMVKLTSVTGDTSRVKCRRKSAGVYTKFQRGQGNKDLDDYPLIDIKSKPACSGIIHRLDHVLLPTVFDPFKDLLVNPIDEEEEVPESEEEEEPEPEEEEEPELPEEEEPELPEEEEPESEEEEEPELPEEEEPEPEEEEEEEPELPEEEDPEAEEEEEEEEVKYTLDGIDFGRDKEEIKETYTMEDFDFGRDKKCVNCVTGSDIEVTYVEQSVEKAAEDVEEEKKGPRIGALGINLIIFSTLLLCFVFVCMRR